MTYEEAIKVLRFVLDPREYPNGEKSKCYQYNLGAINKAIDALEKQIPKKPIIEREQTSPFGVDDVPYCPNCKCSLPEVSYCEECGQAIDWSDIND